MMNKIKLLGLSRVDDHHVYTFVKSKATYTALCKFLSTFGLYEEEARSKYSDNAYTDKYIAFEQEFKEQFSCRAEIFFGSKKVILSLFAPVARQQEIVDKMMSFCEFKENFRKA